jgi:hypothetical protein
MATTSDGKFEGRFTWLKEWGTLIFTALTLVSTSYQFYFKEFVVPEHRPTTLEVNTRLEQAGQRGNLSFIRIAVHASNPTDRRIHVPAMWLSLVGFSLGDQSCDAKPDWRKALSTPENSVYPAFNPPADVALLAQRRLWTEGAAFFEPKEVANFEDVVALPTGRFDYVKLNVNYLAARSIDALDPDQPVGWREERGLWIAEPRFRKMLALKDSDGVGVRDRKRALDRLSAAWEKVSGTSNFYESVLPLMPAATHLPQATGSLLQQRSPSWALASSKRIPCCPESCPEPRTQDTHGDPSRTD